MFHYNTAISRIEYPKSSQAPAYGKPMKFMFAAELILKHFTLKRF
jgi:hypothetical protein